MPAREGRHYRYMDTEFWAERGMITLVDLKKAEDATLNEDEYTKRLSPGKFMKHAIGAMVAAGDRYPSFSYQLRKLCDDAATAAKLAKAQGDPTDVLIQSIPDDQSQLVHGLPISGLGQCD